MHVNVLASGLFAAVTKASKCPPFNNPKLLRALLPAENRGGADTDQEVGGDDAPAAGGAVAGS